MILANYQSIPVEVLAAEPLPSLRGQVGAYVQALEGEPFDQYTHGGWCKTSARWVRAENLTHILQVTADTLFHPSIQSITPAEAL